MSDEANVDEVELCYTKTLFVLFGLKIIFLALEQSNLNVLHKNLEHSTLLVTFQKCQCGRKKHCRTYENERTKGTNNAVFLLL